MLPFALRQHFLQHGYVVIPASVLLRASSGGVAENEPSVVAKVENAELIREVRETVFSAVTARSNQFLKLPSMESVLKSSTRIADPVYTKMMRRMAEYQARRKKYLALRKRYRALKRQARAGGQTSSLGGTPGAKTSGEELWRMTEAVLTQLQAHRDASRCASTVDNDPQLLRAISEHRVNLWMTNKTIETNVTKGIFGKAIGQAAAEVAGVERPVLFSDMPIVRPAYSRPFCFHCSSPWVGVSHHCGQVAKSPPSATAYVCLHEADQVSMQPFVCVNSHREAVSQLWPAKATGHRKVDMEALKMDFVPMESFLPFMTQHFSFSDDVVATPIQGLCPGDVLLVDSHMFVGFGPNLSSRDKGFWMWNVVAESATPSLRPCSWLRSWRTSSNQIDFRAASVFPKLF